MNLRWVLVGWPKKRKEESGETTIAIAANELPKEKKSTLFRKNQWGLCESLKEERPAPNGKGDHLQKKKYKGFPQVGWGEE